MLEDDSDDFFRAEVKWLPSKLPPDSRCFMEDLAEL